MVERALGHEQHPLRRERLHELGVVADEHHGARPAASALATRRATAGRGCWSARRAAAGCAGRRPVGPRASLVFSPPDSVPASWKRDVADRPNMPSSARSSRSVGIRLLAHVLEHGDAGVDPLVLLRVVARRHAMPQSERRPASGSVWPARMRSRLVLPAPLSPSRAGARRARRRTSRRRRRADRRSPWPARRRFEDHACRLWGGAGKLHLDLALALGRRRLLGLHPARRASRCDLALRARFAVWWRIDVRQRLEAA